MESNFRTENIPNEIDEVVRKENLKRFHLGRTKRKIIQISTLGGSERLVALCDDGSLWWAKVSPIITKKPLRWIPLENVPQP